MRFSTASATFTSLAPLDRLMPSATTGSPLKRAKVRRSAIESVTVPRSSSGTSPPGCRVVMVPAGSLSVLAPGRRENRLLVLAELRPPAGKVDVGATQAPADIDGRQPGCLKAVGIER